MATNQEKIEALKSAVEIIENLGMAHTPAALSRKTKAGNAHPIIQSMIEELQDEELRK